MDDILSLKIQGATAVATEGVKAFCKHAIESPLQGDEFWRDLLNIKRKLN